MSGNGLKYKNARVKRAINGYVLTYDKYSTKGEYDGLSHVGECEFVFKDGAKAIRALDEVVESECYLPQMLSPLEEEAE
jgi:hypothetical protein